jgi:plasmid replication initiation protein
MTTPRSQPDLFLAVIGDAPFRDQLDLMSVPVVSLAKGRRAEPIRFQRGNTSVEVSAPPHIGIATIWDFDFVLWAVSQLNDAVNLAADRGEPMPPPTIRAPAYDILRAVGRGAGGKDYLALREALDRLKATTIRTTIRANGKRGSTFSLVEQVEWAEDPLGKPLGVSVTLPQWLYGAVLDRRVLSLDSRYFELTSGLGRWLYRVARKQAGDRADGWRWAFTDLHERSGVTRDLKRFAHDLRRLAEANNLPEYWLTAYADAHGVEHLHACRRSKLSLDHPGREIPIRKRRGDPAL